MRRTLRALRNYVKHAHEDRTFRVAFVVGLYVLLIFAIVYKPAAIVILDGQRCRPSFPGYVTCPYPLPSPGILGPEKGQKTP